MRQILRMEISTILPYGVPMDFRGDPGQANVHLCIHYRPRLPGRRLHPITPLFLHSENLQGSHLLVCLDRNGVVNFRCGESPGYRRRYRRRRDPFLYMGRVQHPNGRRSRCWGGIRNRRRPRRLVFAFAYSLLSSIPHIFHLLRLFDVKVFIPEPATCVAPCLCSPSFLQSSALLISRLSLQYIFLRMIVQIGSRTLGNNVSKTRHHRLFQRIKDPLVFRKELASPKKVSANRTCYKLASVCG